MTHGTGIGRIVNRGLLALGIGLMFMWFSLRPEHFEEAPPVFIRIIMFAAGAALTYAGVLSMRFSWKRGNLLRSDTPVAAEICVLADDDPDRGTETVHVRVNGRCQALGVDRSGAVHKYVDGIVRWGDVWLDDEGLVHAIAISDEHFKPLIGGRDIPADRFGAKE
jgi:hypothetical protein